MKSAAEKMGKGQFLKQLEPPTAQKKKKKKKKKLFLVICCVYT